MFSAVSLSHLDLHSIVFKQQPTQWNVSGLPGKDLRDSRAFTQWVNITGHSNSPSAVFLSSSLAIWRPRVCFSLTPDGLNLRNSGQVNNNCEQSNCERNQGNGRLSRMNLKLQWATNPCTGTLSGFLCPSSLHLPLRVTKLTVRGRY